MTSWTRKIRRAQRGNAMIEFVLVLPLLLVLLLGAIDWGFYFMIREAVINATREGARVGSVATSSAAATTDAKTAVRNYLSNAFGTTYSNAATDARLVVGPTTVAGSPAVSVQLLNYPVVPGRPTTSITGFGAFTRVPTTITSQSQMRLESP
jgi:Flp pilus assembly protein TadG